MAGFSTLPPKNLRHRYAKSLSEICCLLRTQRFRPILSGKWSKEFGLTIILRKTNVKTYRIQ